ncbi:hypothetical protein ACH47C_07185 [Streptomyces rishiriensis]|uniref:hypothetical protein n=1 Tax=Streptomyces rishiriensis TaxID=68264 RepID=UPI00131EF235|nr:hypothetical protein [Streptomyces rishiriensis]
MTALDVPGLGATPTHQVKDGDPDSSGTVFGETRQAWCDPGWTHLAEQPVRAALACLNRASNHSRPSV